MPEVVKGDAQVSGVLLSVPDQQLLPQGQRPAAAVQDGSSVLKRHQVLFLLITGKVHIPGGRRRRRGWEKEDGMGRRGRGGGREGDQEVEEDENMKG